MKIVIIDDLNLEPRQIEILKKGNQVIVFNDKPLEEQAIKRVKKAEIIVTNTTKVSQNIVNFAPKLKMIAAAATGAEAIVDLEAARKRQIMITNVPAYATESVAELTFGLILNLVRKINLANQSVRKGNNLFQPFLGFELKGKTLGIIGLGRIGKRVAEIAQVFKMKVVANDIRPKQKKGVKMVSLNKLLKISDIITIHCNLNWTSNNLLTEKGFKLMKKRVVLINTAREEIINQEALLWALENNKLAGLGLELNILRANLTNHSLLRFNNIILTPHIGFFTKEALKKRKQIVFDNIKSFLSKMPKNIFNLEGAI